MACQEHRLAPWSSPPSAVDAGAREKWGQKARATRESLRRNGKAREGDAHPDGEAEEEKPEWPLCEDLGNGGWAWRSVGEQMATKPSGLTQLRPNGSSQPL